MRYMLNVNPTGASALLDTLEDIVIDSDLRVQFRQPSKGLANGAVTQVRLVDSDGANTSVFRPRDGIGNRYRTTLNEREGRTLGLRGKKRYELKAAGRSGWFWLVPHSNVGKGRKIGGPGITVSIYDK